jgi:four helix bundle protein
LFSAKFFYMATITKFEDLDVWQLARAQADDFSFLLQATPLTKDYELRNQMNASSGSVMDCIAEGFERSGNNEFRNFLVIAKGSNYEYRSQLYRCSARNYISKEKSDELCAKNVTIRNKLMSFINYLQTSLIKDKQEKKNTLRIKQTSNFKPRTL